MEGLLQTIIQHMDDAALCNAAADVLEHWLLTIVLQLSGGS